MKSAIFDSFLRKDGLFLQVLFPCMDKNTSLYATINFMHNNHSLMLLYCYYSSSKQYQELSSASCNHTWWHMSICLLMLHILHSEKHEMHFKITRATTKVQRYIHTSSSVQTDYTIVCQSNLFSVVVCVAERQVSDPGCLFSLAFKDHFLPPK